MGAHWAWLGYASVNALVDEARSGIEGQLRLMLRYIEKAGLTDALRRRDWAAFARGYNGPGFARNSYHLRLALAYRRYSRQAPAPAGRKVGSGLLRKGDRGEPVKHLQGLLSALGYPIAADGIFGPKTHEAVLAFQRQHRLAADGIAGPMTMDALEEAQTPESFAWLWRGLSGLWRRIVDKFGAGAAS